MKPKNNSVQDILNIQDEIDNASKNNEEQPVNKNLDLQTANDVIGEITETAPKKRSGRGRKSKDQKETENKEAEQLKVLDAIFKSSIALIVINLTSLVSFFTKDKRWDAEPEEADLIGQALIASLDHHFPNWKLASPDLALATAILGYVSKRVFSVKNRE